MLHGRITQFASACLIGLASIALITPDARAIVVTVGEDAEVVFDSGGFEEDRAGTLPGSSADPAVGSYQTDNTRGVTVNTDEAIQPDGPDAAAEGDNYLTLSRSIARANARSWLTCEFSRDVDPRRESIQIRYRQWGTPQEGSQSDGFGMSIGDAEADGTDSKTANILTSFGFNPRVSALVSFTNQGSIPVKPSIETAWQVGQWNDVAYTWDARRKRASLDINGTTFELINQLDDPPTVNQFHVRVGSQTSEAYFDSVPDDQP